MPWTWGESHPDGISIVAKAKQTEAPLRFQAEYLKRRMADQQDRFDTAELDDAQKAAYLNHVVDDWKGEADESMKQEFKSWLQGTHSANTAGTVGRTYSNGPGKVPRKHVYRNGNHIPGQLNNNWQHTNWGSKQLTHLPGVRDWLRRQAEAEKADQFDLNMLAEHGPQALEQAWMYFKTWVKGMPESDAVNFDEYGSWATTRSSRRSIALCGYGRARGYADPSTR